MAAVRFRVESCQIQIQIIIIMSLVSGPGPTQLVGPASKPKEVIKFRSECGSDFRSNLGLIKRGRKAERKSLSSNRR